MKFATGLHYITHQLVGHGSRDSPTSSSPKEVAVSKRVQVAFNFRFRTSFFDPFSPGMAGLGVVRRPTRSSMGWNLTHQRKHKLELITDHLSHDAKVRFRHSSASASAPSSVFLSLSAIVNCVDSSGGVVCDAEKRGRETSWARTASHSQSP